MTNYSIILSGRNQGEQVTTKRLNEIAQLADVSPEWLVHGDEESLNNESCVPSKCSIPVYGHIPAGNLAVVEETPIETINFNTLMEPEGLKNTVVIKVCGQSMNKLIPHGSYVAIQPALHEDLKDGAVYVVVLPNGVTCKKVVLQRNGILLVPCSSDPAFREEFVPIEDFTNESIKLYKIIKVLPGDDFLTISGE